MFTALTYDIYYLHKVGMVLLCVCYSYYLLMAIFCVYNSQYPTIMSD